MRSFLISTIILIFVFAFNIKAQNYKSIAKIADILEEQVDELTDRTSRNIKKGKDVTILEIEQAFLSEQLSASTKLMKRLVDEKYPISELRSGSKILMQMIPNFPTDGENINEWNEVKRLVKGLDSELNTKSVDKIAKTKTFDSKNIRGRVFWTGQVDATVHLIIQGSQIKTRTVSGKTYKDGIPSFTSPLPDSGDYLIGVKKKDGRGKVKIIQQPNAENKYTAIVEIFDKGSGAKSYTVEIFW